MGKGGRIGRAPFCLMAVLVALLLAIPAFVRMGGAAALEKERVREMSPEDRATAEAKHRQVHPLPPRPPAQVCSCL